uniref:Beta-lactamase domain-containing protein n=1 Tax=Steinernema glaseri TaxID=37863 RepID=A0A1I7ZKM5_9BILA
MSEDHNIYLGEFEAVEDVDAVPGTAYSKTWILQLLMNMNEDDLDAVHDGEFIADRMELLLEMARTSPENGGTRGLYAAYRPDLGGHYEVQAVQRASHPRI